MQKIFSKQTKKSHRELESCLKRNWKETETRKEEDERLFLENERVFPRRKKCLLMALPTEKEKSIHRSLEDFLIYEKVQKVFPESTRGLRKSSRSLGDLLRYGQEDYSEEDQEVYFSSGNHWILSQISKGFFQCFLRILEEKSQ